MITHFHTSNFELLCEKGIMGNVFNTLIRLKKSTVNTVDSADPCRLIMTATVSFFVSVLTNKKHTMLAYSRECTSTILPSRYWYLK